MCVCPGEVIRCTRGAKTLVRTVYGNSNCFEVKVGMHQGSALSPFVIVMEALSRKFRVPLTREMYNDDLVVKAKTTLNKRRIET